MSPMLVCIIRFIVFISFCVVVSTTTTTMVVVAMGKLALNLTPTNKPTNKLLTRLYNGQISTIKLKDSGILKQSSFETTATVNSKTATQ